MSMKILSIFANTLLLLFYIIILIYLGGSAIYDNHPQTLIINTVFYGLLIFLTIFHVRVIVKISKKDYIFSYERPSSNMKKVNFRANLILISILSIVGYCCFSIGLIGNCSGPFCEVGPLLFGSTLLIISEIIFLLVYKKFIL